MIWNEAKECISRDELHHLQSKRLVKQVDNVYHNVEYYRKKMQAMGVEPGQIRLWIAVCSTLVTASAVSVSGMIGWVGLVIPHMMRRLVGSDYRFLMPASMLGGGVFLLIVDNVSRNATTSGIPIGILTAFIGAPFFLWLITGKGDHYEH